MKKVVIFAVFLLVSKFSYSQIQGELSENLFKVNILTPGVTYQVGLSTSTLLNLDANFSLGGTMSGEGQFKLVAVPFVRAQYQCYYNLQRRLRKNKSIDGNSGSYLAPSVSYYGKPINDDFRLSSLDGLTAGAVWGFQKTYRSNINLSANAGLGYNFSDKISEKLVPILNFTVAWVILK